ncbi:MAG: AAA family ATPase [Desulfovibrionaceae bacterium]|nr:AAA family ATPase [Desulfovibrionaceae bacterium]
MKGELSDKIIREFNAEGIALTNAIGIRDPDSVLDEILQKVPDNSTVLLIDEYDAPLTRRINEPEELKEVLDVLSDFYATVKEYSDKFRLIFITGVTRASHVSIFSAFNNLVDLSLEENLMLYLVLHRLIYNNTLIYM